MNERERMAYLREKVTEVDHQLRTLEIETYWTEEVGRQIVRLKRVKRALLHDIVQIEERLPKPVQYSFLEPVAPPAIAAAQLEQEPLEDDDHPGWPLPNDRSPRLDPSEPRG